jgi:nucleotide-binding universal stress UspA family protein
MLSIGKILVPTDFSACSSEALRWARIVGAKFGARIDVLHVWEPPRYVIPEIAIQMPGEPQQSLLDFAKAEASKEMEAFISPGSDQSPPVQARLQSGDPTDTIIQLAESDRYDLIIMGTHGRTGISHLLLGSVAEKVVRRAPCPVMTIRQCERSGD